MKNTYKLTSQKLKEPIVLEYTDGHLNAVLMPIKQPLTTAQFTTLIRDNLQQHEDCIAVYAGCGLTVEQVEPPDRMPANQKVALFCELYFKHKGVKYSASRQDGGKIKEKKLNEEILTAYFTSTNFLFKGKHSIANLCKYYNELLAEMAEAGKAKFPNNWSKEYESKLKPFELPEYWRHLKSLGLAPKKDRLGNITDWIRKELL